MAAGAAPIRDATSADAAALLDIYRPYVESSTVSFETEVPSLQAFGERISKARSGWAWLVALDDAGQAVGYAYASAHRERAAYRYTSEVSVYVHAAHQGRGLARQLYAALFDRMRGLGLCTALAGVTQPNAPSMALHLALGFQPVGVFHRAGWKFGAWHDVAWLELPLRDLPLGARAPGQLPD